MAATKVYELVGGDVSSCAIEVFFAARFCSEVLWHRDVDCCIWDDHYELLLLVVSKCRF